MDRRSPVAVSSSRGRSRAARGASFALGLALSLATAGCASPIFGGECAVGYQGCGGRCVPLDDPNHCGGCGVVCAIGASCSGGVCIDPTVDAGPFDAATGDVDAALDAAFVGLPDASLDAGLTNDASDDASSGDDDADIDAGTDDAGTDAARAGFLDAGRTTDPIRPPPPCSLGLVLCDGLCVDLDTDPAHCGSCDAPCADDERCSAGRCGAVCEAPYELCDGLCVDTSSSVASCGGCGRTCEFACVDGACVVPPDGELVLVGHGFETSAGDDLERVLANALAITGESSPVVVPWVGAGDGSFLATIARLAPSAAIRTAPSADDVTRVLEGADLFVIGPQDDTTTDDELDLWASSWSTAVKEFLAFGGVVVVLDAPSVAHHGTWQLPVGMSLVAITGSASAEGDTLAPTGASLLTSGAASSFTAPFGTRRYVGTSAPAALVDVDAASGPVVLFRTFSL